MLRIILATLLFASLICGIVSGQERQIAVSLTETQWNVIAKCLSKEPFGDVVTIMSELQRQTRSEIAKDASEKSALVQEIARLKLQIEQLEKEGVSK